MNTERNECLSGEEHALLQRLELDELAYRFETAWQAGQGPDLAQYVAQVSSERCGALLQELVAVDLQYRWAQGEQRFVEAYLADWSELRRDPAVLCELLLAELSARRTHGHEPGPGEYQSRFPELDLSHFQAATSPSGAEDSAPESPPRPRFRDYARRFPPVSSPEELPKYLVEDEGSVCGGRDPTCDDRLLRNGEGAGALAEFAGTKRLAVQRRIGAGGMGVVFQAFDRERNEIVALKTLRHLEPTALYYLKREFRSLADIRHPNLVRLYELFCEDGRWFFTMEFVDGVEFLGFVRCASCSLGAASATSQSEAADLQTAGPASLVDTSATPRGSPPAAILSAAQLVRLRDVLRQLAEGVTALHRAGKLHRDIKPSNVLVTLDGRVVLLDFGLSMELNETTTGRYLVGTAAYMSPEQGMGDKLSPSSDWYSVGVMLYEALTGRLPFAGQSLQVLLSKREADPPPPVELWGGVPADLNSLCMALLQRDPAARPSEEEILRRFGDMPTEATAREALRHIPFVGRETEMRVMQEALAAVRQGRTEVVCVCGKSGVGKTALVQQFLAAARPAHSAVILAGRCYERESVPFKALDSLVDSLSHYLMGLARLEVDALLPRDVAALSQAFPVLARVEAVAQALARSVATPDRWELRDRAFRALRELLARLGDRATLVLHIDDLQWGDRDSEALLHELLCPPDPPALLLLLCCRSEDATSSPEVRRLLPPDGAVVPQIHVQSIDVEPLPFREARDLAKAILRERGADADTLSDAIAHESGGNPYFLGALASRIRRSTLTTESLRGAGNVLLDDMLCECVSQLPEPARCLLEVVSVAGHPLREKDALEAARITAQGHVALHGLRAACMVRATPMAAHDGVEAYHDRVREVVVSHLGADVLAEWHGRLAGILERNRAADPATLAQHYAAAGQSQRAGAWFAVAAEEASRLLAFDRAVTMSQLALARLSPEESRTRDVTRKLADALANAGRGAEAARQYLAAAEGASADQAVVFRRHAATQFLTCGHVQAGLESLQSVLNTVGARLPSTRYALLLLVYRRILVRLRGLSFRPRAAEHVPEDLRTKIDIFWSASMGLSMIDHVRAADFQARCLLLSLRAGVPSLVARSLCLEAAHVAASGGSAQRRAAHLLEKVETLARPLNNPYLIGLQSLAKGTCAYFCGRWRSAVEYCEEAETTFRDHCAGVTWELDTAIGFGLSARSFAGDVRELAERLPLVLSEAGKRGDVYATVYNGTITLPALAADDPEAAAETLLRWRREDFRVQRFDELVAHVDIDLYRDCGEAAWERVGRHWSGLARSFLFHVQFLRGCAHFARARSALAAARCLAHPDHLLRVAERDARQLAGEKQPWTAPLAELILAGVDSFRGQLAQACDRLQIAARLFDAADMPLYSLSATRRLGELLGGHDGHAWVARADAGMRSRGIRDASRMAAVYAPGFPARALDSQVPGERNVAEE